MRCRKENVENFKEKNYPCFKFPEFTHENKNKKKKNPQR